MEQQQTPESLARRRDRVREWITTARAAILSFQRPDGSFWRDSKLAEAKTTKKLNNTTTARCYMALVYADRCCVKGDEKEYRWREEFAKYLGGLKIDWNDTVDLSLGEAKDSNINNFELAHLADLSFARSYLEKYARMKPVESPSLAAFEGKLKEHFSALTKKDGFDGRFHMEGASGPHYFVNLHAARAHAILGVDAEWAKSGVESLRRYCQMQCFYAQRGLHHKVDGIQLILAGVACALYDDNPPVELYEALVDAIQALQQSGGNWPATHPVFLKEGKPWHITSHEMALCLTWLYYVPHITDESRRKLLGMMEVYFEQWVVRTYVRAVGPFSGWYDDHHVDDNYVVGWATAIVGHFLSNYYWILGHEVNRRVIESLGLVDSAEHYRFDASAPEVARVLPSEADPAWPDLPPYAWDTKQDATAVTNRIRKKWSDPSEGRQFSADLANKIVRPILESSNTRPSKAKCAGILDGSPGTRKTSLVREIAGSLRWPLITIPGSTIFSSGWDQMEARAADVFRRLKLLTNAVIFFDEFEEFFRARKQEDDDDAPTVDNRTIAAFMTSGMLPRLQELHDEGRCLVFLATNSWDTIDQAVRRAGRFDFRLTVEHPQPKRILEYVRETDTRIYKELVATNKDKVEAAIVAVENALKERKGDKSIPFKIVEDALRRAIAAGEPDKAARSVLTHDDNLDAPALADVE